MVAAENGVQRFNVLEQDPIFGPHNRGEEKNKSDLDCDCSHVNLT